LGVLRNARSGLSRRSILEKIDCIFPWPGFTQLLVDNATRERDFYIAFAHRTRNFATHLHPDRQNACCETLRTQDRLMDARHPGRGVVFFARTDPRVVGCAHFGNDVAIHRQRPLWVDPVYALLKPEDF
jgi:hypothetical protein